MPYINELEHEMILRMLKSSGDAAINDKATLSAYERGEISIGEAKYQFMLNNDISLDTFISNDLFDRWARSLGYLRRKE